jgi:integrase
MGWRLLAATRMRRGEALDLRWRDVDLDVARLVGRRSVGVVKAKGAGEQLIGARPRQADRGSSTSTRTPSPRCAATGPPAEGWPLTSCGFRLSY